MDLCSRLGLDFPILQAGMAGGLVTPELAAAVSRGGGLGTLGLQSPERLDAQVRAARDLAPGRPLAVNLLLPFTRRAHLDVCIARRVDAAVLFFGFDRTAVARLRAAGVLVLHQVGTVDQLRRAFTEGADAVIAQGAEAGGHLLGHDAALTFLRSALDAAGDKPVLLAGGIATAAHVRAAMEAGASGIVCGSRFLLTEECAAHATYKRRALGATRTLDVELFGFGWPARHRVLPNAATERWCRIDARGTSTVRRVNRWTGSLARIASVDARGFARLQRVGIPFFTPSAPLVGDDERLVEVSALYAGESVRHLTAIVPAEQALRELSAGCAAG